MSRTFFSVNILFRLKFANFVSIQVLVETADRPCDLHLNYHFSLYFVIQKNVYIDQILSIQMSLTLSESVGCAKVNSRDYFPALRFNGAVIEQNTKVVRHTVNVQNQHTWYT